jgi:type IX secretion system PorP/SprF family membrane protein
MSALSKKIAVFTAFVFTVALANAQDAHFSQFYHSPLQLNPALAGVHHGSVRFINNYKSQWQSVSDLNFTTFSSALEKKFYTDDLENSYFTAGLLLSFDQAGTSKLSRTNIGVSGSYSIQLSPTFFITAGAHVGISQRAFKTTNLTFDQQFDGEQFDPNRPREGFSRTNDLNMDLGSGINLRLQPQDAHPITKRTKLDIGVAAHHITEPKEAFFIDGEVQLKRRYSTYAMGTLMLSDLFDFVARGMVQLQGPYQENVVGASGKIHINRNPAQELAVLFGSSYRFDSFGDAIIPHMEIEMQQWLLGVSYDVNISEFQAASSRRGGIEIALRYIFAPLKPVNKTKICPII